MQIDIKPFTRIDIISFKLIFFYTRSLNLSAIQFVWGYISDVKFVFIWLWNWIAL